VVPARLGEEKVSTASTARRVFEAARNRVPTTARVEASSTTSSWHQGGGMNHFGVSASRRMACCELAHRREARESKARSPGGCGLGRPALEKACFPRCRLQATPVCPAPIRVRRSPLSRTSNRFSTGWKAIPPTVCHVPRPSGLILGGAHRRVNGQPSPPGALANPSQGGGPAERRRRVAGDRRKRRRGLSTCWGGVRSANWPGTGLSWEKSAKSRSTVATAGVHPG